MTAEQLARLLGSDWALERKGGSDNLTKRLALGLKHLVTNGLIASGTRLPAERALALAFNVSRPTVTAALGDLRAAGLIESRQGSGSWVLARETSRDALPAMAELVFTDHGINLAAATPADASHVGALTVGLGDFLSGSPAHGYDPVGLPELRCLLAARLQAHGLPTTEDEIIVTNGAHHALALIIGALIQPDDCVIVEEHTYGGFLDLLEVARAKPIAVARDAAGTRPDELGRAIRRFKPRLVYLMPSIHAPTGSGTSAARRIELSHVLDEYHAVVIADETLSDLHNQRRAPSLASLCSAESVIGVESLSKSVWGGLRIGWIRTSADHRQRLLRHRAHVDLGTSIAAQHTALSVVRRIDQILSDRITELPLKAAHLRASLGAALPDWSTPIPDGGLCLWVDIPLADSSRFTAAAAREGVILMPGTVARADRGPDSHVRICFDRNLHVLDEAVERLTRAWEKFRDSAPTTASVLPEHRGSRIGSTL